MIKIHELNQSDRIIIYNYKGMNIYAQRLKEGLAHE